MKLEWLPQALYDFDEIIDFIAEDNPVAAIEAGRRDRKPSGRVGR